MRTLDGETFGQRHVRSGRVGQAVHHEPGKQFAPSTTPDADNGKSAVEKVSHPRAGVRQSSVGQRRPGERHDIGARLEGEEEWRTAQ